MYEVDALDTVFELSDVPRPDVGAPLPQMLVTEHRLLLAYLVSEPDPDWDGTYVNIISPETNDLAVALVDFHLPYAHMFGPPNDEAFDGHPLASRGLHPYAVFEVMGSSWIRKLERMNSVHRCHNKQQFMANRRHVVFAFHDTTFECVAKGFTVQTFRGSMRKAFARMVELSADPPA
jgi:hypothetical protein